MLIDLSSKDSLEGEKGEGPEDNPGCAKCQGLGPRENPVGPYLK